MIKKVLLLAVIVLALSYFGQTLSGKLYLHDSLSLSHSLNLIKDHLGFFFLSQIVYYACEMGRFFLIARALNCRPTLKENFGATSLNLLFGWLSPAAILGAPAMAYFLYKRGYPLVTSLTMAFVRSFSIIFVSAISTVVIYGMRLQGEVKNPVLQEKIYFILTGIAVYLGVVVLLSFIPNPLVRKSKVLEKITSQIRLFLTSGKLYILPILLMTLVSNFLMVCFIPYAFINFYDRMTMLLSQTMLFLSYTLLMPTPGASGLAEIGAPLYFQGNVPIGEIVSTVTAMRISNISFQIVIGLLCLFFLMKNQMTFSDLKAFKENTKN